MLLLLLFWYVQISHPTLFLSRLEEIFRLCFLTTAGTDSNLFTPRLSYEEMILIFPLSFESVDEFVRCCQLIWPFFFGRILAVIRFQCTEYFLGFKTLEF